MTRAKETSVETRGANVEEQKDLWIAEKKLDITNSRTLEELLDDMEKQKLITSKERKNIDVTGQVTIGKRTIVFADDYIKIFTKEDLEQFRDNVNNGNSYKGQKVVLMGNIDLGGDENDTSTWWNSIGFYDDSTTDVITFDGIFDGNNFSITGIYNKMNTTNNIMGFFGEINNATIQNLRVEGKHIVGETIYDDQQPSGGGMVGHASGTCKIINCINEIEVQKLYGGREAGGIIGDTGEGNLTISNCINKADIVGANNCAGIAGIVYGNLIIEDCHNEGNITNIYGNYAGGLIGRDGNKTTHNITIRNSYNSGTIKGKANLGGLIGRIGYATTEHVIIEDCYNEGNIIQENKTSIGQAGGIIANCSGGPGSIEIINSYNNKDIEMGQGAGQISGGLIGLNKSIDTKIINCYNLGSMTGDYASGIVGRLQGEKLNIINCYNIGAAQGAIISSGIVNRLLSTAAIGIQNAYYLKSVASMGVTNYTLDETEALEENYMKSEDFVKKLNDNQINIETEFTLKKWEYEAEKYPKINKKTP